MARVGKWNILSSVLLQVRDQEACSSPAKTLTYTDKGKLQVFIVRANLYGILPIESSVIFHKALDIYFAGVNK